MALISREKTFWKRLFENFKVGDVVLYRGVAYRIVFIDSQIVHLEYFFNKGSGRFILRKDFGKVEMLEKT